MNSLEEKEEVKKRKVVFPKSESDLNLDGVIIDLTHYPGDKSILFEEPPKPACDCIYTDCNKGETTYYYDDGTQRTEKH